MYESITSFSDPKFANFSSQNFKNAKGISVINITIDLTYPITKAMIQFTVSTPKDKNDKNYEKILIQSNINACRLISGVVGDFLSKMIMANLKDHVDFDLKCPISNVCS